MFFSAHLNKMLKYLPVIVHMLLDQMAYFILWSDLIRFVFIIRFHPFWSRGEFEQSWWYWTMQKIVHSNPVPSRITIAGIEYWSSQTNDNMILQKNSSNHSNNYFEVHQGRNIVSMLLNIPEICAMTSRHVSTLCKCCIKIRGIWTDRSHHGNFFVTATAKHFTTFLLTCWNEFC